ncbi:glycosyltransferase family 4 protein [Marinobacter sp. BGYM27]|uniref:glycosyltransferase family 4 protein n=1 Tax=Marinobacter sp. BGYM27 TaxID=2975597 RepID=UPI0021A566BA|nr:glycosyltransferase family 4 protein [Marinobacter sp. BGYM27]MDG5501340.1 glycosyltransferase family 4 protein [Marinobacter sp. BGYM27]
MKVLQVLPALDSGGVERGTLEIAEALVQAGHESWVVSAGGRLVSQLEAAGSRHVHWDLGRKSPKSLLQVRPFRRWLSQNEFDIVHARSRMPAWITLMALKRLAPGQAPHLVTTVHGLHSVNRYSAVMTRGERIIAVSETCRRYILDNYPSARAEHIRLIHRGIDPSQFPRDFQPSTEWQANWQQEYPQLQGKFIVTLPGRLTRLKGHREWLQAIARLSQRMPDLAGLIVGGDAPGKADYAAEVRQQIKDNGLENIVTMTGHRTDMREIYAASNVIISLSTKPESFGRTVLEPLAMGVPVVGYARGGVAEILQALYPAGAVEPGDLEGIVDAILGVYNGQHTDVKPNDVFLLEKMQAETLKVYQELVAP